MKLLRWVPWWLSTGLVLFVALVWRFPNYVVEIAVALLTTIVVFGVWQLLKWLRGPRIGDWRDAEEAAARWLRGLGCRRVTLTGGSADGGIDVITADWAVQVKHTTKRVGRPAIQQTVGAALTLERDPAVFSTSGFSAPAVAYALDHDVALFELDLDGRAHAVNRPARRVGQRFARLRRR